MNKRKLLLEVLKANNFQFKSEANLLNVEMRAAKYVVMLMFDEVFSVKFLQSWCKISGMGNLY